MATSERIGSLREAQEFEARSLALSQLSGELVASLQSGKNPGEQEEILRSIRDQLEALQAESTTLAVLLLKKQKFQ